MYRHRIPGWADIVANARAEAERNPQAFTSGMYAGQNYAACALNNAVSEGHADEEYAGLNEYGYEAAVFRLTPEDAQTLDCSNENGVILSRFSIVRDDNGKVEMSAYETDQELDAFIGAIEDDLAAYEDQYEPQDDAHNRHLADKPRPAPEPHEQLSLL